MADRKITGVEMNVVGGYGIKGDEKPDFLGIAGLSFAPGQISPQIKGYATVGYMGYSINAYATGMVTVDRRLGTVTPKATITIDTTFGAIAYAGLLSFGAEVVTSSDQVHLNLGMGAVNLSIHTQYGLPSFARGPFDTIEVPFSIDGVSQLIDQLSIQGEEVVDQALNAVARAVAELAKAYATGIAADGHVSLGGAMVGVSQLDERTYHALMNDLRAGVLGTTGLKFDSAVPQSIKDLARKEEKTGSE